MRDNSTGNPRRHSGSFPSEEEFGQLLRRFEAGQANEAKTCLAMNIELAWEWRLSHARAFEDEKRYLDAAVELRRLSCLVRLIPNDDLLAIEFGRVYLEEDYNVDEYGERQSEILSEIGFGRSYIGDARRLITDLLAICRELHREPSAEVAP